MRVSVMTLLGLFWVLGYSAAPVLAQAGAGGTPTLGGRPVTPNANAPKLNGQPVGPNANAPTLNGQMITPNGGNFGPNSNPAIGTGANTNIPFIFPNNGNGFGFGSGLGTALGTGFAGSGFFPFGYTAGYPGYLSYGGYGQPGFTTSVGTLGDDSYSAPPPDPQSMLVYEEARSKYIDNMRKWTREYARMREAAQMYRREKIEKERHSPEALAKAAEVHRLGRDEYDSVTGNLFWPDALKTEEYADERTELEHLFELRARTSQRADAAARIRQITEEMSQTLRSNIENLTAVDFLTARKFLDAMEATVSAPPRNG